MPTILQDARKAFGAAQWHLNVILNLTEVPDHHPVSRKASQIWADLEYIIETIPKVGTRSASMNDEGPAILPVAGRTPDKWMTSQGKTVASLLILTSHQSRLASRKRLRMPRIASKRRAMTKREFIAALKSANPEESAPESVAILTPLEV